MLRFIFDYFIPKFNYQDLSGYKKVQYTSRAKLIVMLTFIVVFVLTTLYSFQFFYFKQSSYSLLLVPFSSLILLVALFVMRQNGNLKIISWALLLLSSTVIPVRVYYAGGMLYTNNMGWYIASLIIVSALRNRKVSIVYFFISIIQIAIMCFISIPLYESSIIEQTFASLSLYLIAALSLVSIVRINRFILSEQKKTEQVETINVMMCTLSHEINNPLTIAKGYLDILKRDIEGKNEQKNEYVDIVQGALGRIAEIVKDIEQIDKNEIIILDKYSNNSKMLSLKKKNEK